MRWTTVVLAVFSIIASASGQSVGPTIRVDTVSSLVWGEDAPSGATSSSITDPVNGYSSRRLTYGGIEVTSRVGFEAISRNETGTLVSYTTIIANSTGSPVSARFRGFSIDNRTATPLTLVRRGKKHKAKLSTSKSDSVELDKMHCFTGGFLPDERFFSADLASQVFSVAPQTAQVVSTVFRDPREYGSMLCSVAGCYPTGTIRYALNVDGHDYVFVWPGSSAAYCGE